jgi:hypothetical protein
VLVVAGAVCAGTAAGVAGATSATSPAQLLLRHALVDAAVRRTFHETATTLSGGRRYTFSDDAANENGTQSVSISDGARASIRLVSGLAFLTANQTYLTKYAHLSSTLAHKVGARWISFAPSDRPYSFVADGLTADSALAETTPTSALTETAPVEMNGQSVVGIEGQAATMFAQPGTTTLYVTRSSFPLPAFATVNLRATTNKPSDHASNTFTRWGEQITLRTPADAIPWSKL